MDPKSRFAGNRQIKRLSQRTAQPQRTRYPTLSPVHWDRVDKRKPLSITTNYYKGVIKRNSTPALFQKGGDPRVVSTWPIFAVFGT